MSCNLKGERWFTELDHGRFFKLNGGYPSAPSVDPTFANFSPGTQSSVHRAAVMAFRTAPPLISGFGNNLAELHQGDLPSLKSLCSKALGRHWSIGMGWDNISQLLLISNPRLRTHKVLDWAKCWGKPA